MEADAFREKWRDADEGHARLKWARRYWQAKANAINPTAAEAASSLGWNEHTYRAYERAPGTSKHTPLDHQAAITFGRKFKVDWHWLLLGDGTPFDGELPEAQARVVDAMAQASEVEQRAVAAMVEAFLQARKAG